MRALAALLLAGCGATGDPGGPPVFRPASGSGPFRRAPAESLPGGSAAPFVLVDAADLDEPWLLADGERLSLWVTARRPGGPRIERADAPSLAQGFGPLQPALDAASGPSIVPPAAPGELWLLFFSQGGSIGLATSADGRSWTRSGAAVPGAGPPAAVRLGDRVRVYFAEDGALRAAEAPFADPTAWRRLDAAPIPAGPLTRGLGRVFARAAPTPAGRVRHDLYLSVQGDAVPLLRFAASYDGDSFALGEAPVLAPPAARGPAAAPYGAGVLLLFVARGPGGTDAIAAALSP